MNTLSAPRQSTTQQSLRARFTDGGLDTASGPKVIQLCYERLDRDLEGALIAMHVRDVCGAHETLCHAQDIVYELLCMLQVDLWEHAGSLAALYRYTLELLTDANVRKDAAPVREARHLLAELGSAFRGGALGAAIEPAVAASSTPSLVSQFSARA